MIPHRDQPAAFEAITTCSGPGGYVSRETTWNAITTGTTTKAASGREANSKGRRSSRSRQRLDDTALIHPAMRTACHHALKLDLQGFEAGDALFHLNQPSAGDLIGYRA
jgi:hypothetical protein